MDVGKVLSDAAIAAIGPTAALYAMAAQGLNVHFGYTGLLNFGQVGFMLVGAYGMAASISIFGLPFWLGIVVGIVASAILALLLGGPTLRLRADYLAITTIAAAEILRFLFRSGPFTSITGGVFGIPSEPGGPGFAGALYRLNPIPQGTYGIGPIVFRHNRLWVALVGWAAVALLTLLAWALMRSPWGRVIKSIREDEDASRALGKNVFTYKMQALVLGGVMGGLSGMILALSQLAITPDAFLPQLTFYAYTILILGGSASVMGPIIGSVIFWFLVQGSDSFLRQLNVSFDVGATRLALVGLGLMLLMIYRPQGILGSKREMMLDA